MEIVLAYDRQEEILALFKEYTEGILQQGDEVKCCLAGQHYEDEVRDLQAKYGLPQGRLFLALADGKSAGCAAITPEGDGGCEIKRLYVKPEFRGRRIARTLLEHCIEAARAQGYKYMRLDTFPFMREALKLYERCGFYYIERYNDNPAASALFMQLDL